MLNFVTFFKTLIKRSIYLISVSFSLFWSGINAIVRIMRPRKRDFRGDTRKGAKNYDTVSSDDSEVYRRKDPFAGRNRKRPSGRRAQLNICNPSLRFGKPPFFIHRSLVIYVLVNSLVLAFESALSATLLFDIDIACTNVYFSSIVIRQLTSFILYPRALKYW